MAAAIAAALFGMPCLAQAQQAAPAGLETVVVTANKRLEKLESVPMAISVVSENEIQRTNLREIEDIVTRTPSLQMAQSTTSANNAIFMRGIGTVSIGIGVESDVAVIVDDIPVATQFQAFRDMADVARIEVLKGPQSTLFGKSAVAGAINVVTKPISGPLAVKATAYHTNDREYRYGVSVGGETSETLGFRLAASKNNQAGLFHNLTDGKDVGGASGKTLVGKLSWHPTANLDIDFLPSYNKQENTRGVVAMNRFTLNGQPVGVANAYLNGNPQLPASAVLAGIDVNNPQNRNLRRDSPTGLDSTTSIAGLKAAYTLPNDAQLVSISSVTRYTARDYRDQDFVDTPTVAAAGSTKLTISPTQFGDYLIRSNTQELRYVSPDKGALRYVAGLWWARNDIDRHFIRGYCVAPMTCSGTSPTSPTNYFTSIYNVNKSVFGQATWDFMPTYTLVAGARLNQEESGFKYARSYYTDQLDRSAFKPGPVGVDQFSSSGNKDNAITGKLSLQKQINKDWMVYAMTATGYKGAAYDVTSGLKASAAFPVTPETSRTWEFGTKANLLNNRLTVAGVVFNSKFKNYQQNTSFTLPNDPTTYTQLSSVPQIGTKGFELDANWMAMPNLTTYGSVAYTRPTIDNWKNGPCYADATNVAAGNTKLAANGSLAGQNSACFPLTPGSSVGIQDLSGKVFAGTPKWKVSVGGNYDFNLYAGYKGYINADVRYQNAYLSSLSNDPNSINKGFAITDLGLGIRASNDAWRLSFRVNNLFDRFYTSSSASAIGTYRNGPTSTSQQISSGGYIAPRDAFRYFSVKLDVKF